jgi:glutathione peroxidase-family protein
MSMLANFVALILVSSPSSIDPSEALQKIQQFRINELRKDPQNTTEQFRTKISAESKRQAQAAVNEFNLQAATPEDCLPWLNLLVLAENSSLIPPTFDKFISSTPSSQAKSAAINLLLDSFYQSKNYAQALSKIDEFTEINPSDAPLVLKAAGDFAIYQSGALSPEELISFLSRQLQKITSPNTSDETRSHAVALSYYYCAKAEIEFKSSDRTASVSTIAEGLADPRLNEDEKNTIVRTKNRLNLVGSPAPEIISDKSIGNFSNLASMKGKVVVISFFANWSLYSHFSFPQLATLNSDLKNQGLEMLGVTKFYGYIENEYSLEENDEFNRMKTFASVNKISWPVIFAPLETHINYGVNALPYTVLIDRKGTVRSILVGYDKASFTNFRKEVETALKEAPQLPPVSGDLRPDLSPQFEPNHH